ncbi:MAG TPA: DUF4149 domain-containing protein [Thermoanaerobaculia bacterium]|nr:DUF4149 domain-containing protein [Thermoanaerobaculia bacterium]
MRLGRWGRDLLVAFWFGGSLFLALIAAPSTFKTSPSRELAANNVGAMLSQWRWVAIGAPLLLLAGTLIAGAGERSVEAGPRRLQIALLTSAFLLALAQFGVDRIIHGMRVSSPVPISRLSPSDPYRRRFGRLHGASALLMMTGTVLAGVVIISRNRTRPGEHFQDD